MPTENDFSGQTAIVTGGGRGIGKAIAMKLGAFGLHVSFTYRNDVDLAKKTLEDIRARGGDGSIHHVDVSQADEVNAFVRDVEDKCGAIDYLVNNAAIAPPVPRSPVTFDRWKEMMGVNLDGVFLTTWAVKDGMLSRKKGSIVNIGSIVGVNMPPEDMIEYGTSKAAVGFFTRACARAFAPNGVRVNCVVPGMTYSEHVAAQPEEIRTQTEMRIPMGRGAQPGEIADSVCFLLSDQAGLVTGQTLAVDGGMT